MVTNAVVATMPPVTIPVVRSTVATKVLLLLQVPPVVASTRSMLEPVHTSEGPVMSGGAGFTVIVVDTVQVVV